VSARPARKNSGAQVIALLEEMLQRPAMNGGFQKLAAQQNEQCDRLERLEGRIEPVEAALADWRKGQRWLLRMVGAVLLGVAVELAVRGLSHLHIN